MPGRALALYNARTAVVAAASRSPEAARAIGARFGLRNVTPSAIGAYMKRHPIATLLGLSSVISIGGMDLSGAISDSEIDQLMEQFADNPRTQEIVAELSRARQKIYDAKGDGNADTVSGISKDKFAASIVLTKEAVDRVRDGIGVIGSLSALEWLVRELPLIELEHLKAYRVLNQ